MNYSKLNGKKIAIAAIGVDEHGEKEGAVWTGIARWENGHLYLDREEDPKVFQFPDNVLKRIKPVPSDLSDILLDSEYYVKLSIGPLPEDADPKDYRQTGLKWPE
jgi:hypothetical protein